jgi:hypothetical protein
MGAAGSTAAPTDISPVSLTFLEEGTTLASSQALHKFKNGVEIQFYVNTAAGKMSRVWWLGNDSGQARRAVLRYKLATEHVTQQ